MKMRDMLIAHPDGSYEPKRSITIAKANGRVTLNPGVRFRAGVKFMGIDITEILDQEIDEKQ